MSGNVIIDSVEFTYLSAGSNATRYISSVGLDGSRIEYTYDDNGYISRTHDRTINSATEYFYNKQGQLIRENNFALGSVGGFFSSVGHDVLFDEGQVDFGDAFLNAVVGGVVGLIGGRGSKKSIENFIATRKILKNTIGKHGLSVITRQTKSVSKHAKDLFISGARYVSGNFTSGIISKQEFYKICI